MARFVLDIEGNSLIWQANVRQATRVNVDFDASLGKIINTEKVLNSLGIKTQRQIQQEVNTRQQLIKLLGKDQPQAVAILKSQLEQLSFQQQVTTNDNRQMQQAFFSLGFILDDSAQFQVGFSQGLRAISNNMIPLVSQVLRATDNIKFMGFAIIGTQLAMSALILLGPTIEDFFDSLGEDAKDTAEELSDFAQAISGLVRLEGLGKLAEITSDQLRVVKEIATADIAVAEGRVRFAETQLELESERLDRLELSAATTAEAARKEREELKKREEALEQQLEILDRSEKAEKGLIFLLDERIRKEEALRLLRSLGLLDETDLTTLQKLVKEENKLTGSLKEQIGFQGILIGEAHSRVRVLEEQISREKALNFLRAQGFAEFALFRATLEGRPIDIPLPDFDDILSRLIGEGEDNLKGMKKEIEEYAKALVEAEQAQLRFGSIVASSFGSLAGSFGSLARQFESGQGALFVASKSFAVAQAIISTFVGATKALELGPVLGPPAAAVMIAAGLANVAKIVATSPGSGAGGRGGGAGRAVTFAGNRGPVRTGSPGGRTPVLGGRPASGLGAIGRNLVIQVEVTGTLQSERGSFHAALETETLRSERLRSI